MGTNEDLMGMELPTSVSSAHDELLSAVVYITELLNCPHSPDRLVAGLPLVNHKLTPELAVRACERVGIDAAIMQRTLSDIAPEILPCILLSENGGAVVLRTLDTASNQAQVTEFKNGLRCDRSASFEQLAKDYSGLAIYLNKRFKPDGVQGIRAPKAKPNRWFWSTVLQSKTIYRDVVLASVFLNLFILANPLFVMNVYDRVVPNNAIETLWVLAIGVSIVFLFDVLIKSFRSHFIEIAGKKADVILSAKLFAKVLGIKMEAMPASVGGFANNLKEFDSVRNFFTSATLTTFIDLPFALLFLLVIYSLGGITVLVPVVAALVIMVYGFVAHYPLKRIIEKTHLAAAQKNANLIETLSGIETIKAFNAEGHRQSLWEQNSGYLAQKGIKIRDLTSSISSFSALATQLTTVAIIIIGVYQIQENLMSMGALIACVMLGSRAVAPMAQVANLTAQYEQTKTALQTLSQIMAMPDEHPEDKRFIYRNKFYGGIACDKVSYRYPNQSQTILQQLTLNIKAGEKVGFIGRIGSGKTTLQKLLLGLYSATEGQIKVDGIDLSQIDPVDLRRNIGYVPQDITLFQGSIRDNVVIKAPYVNDEEVVRVAALAGLDEFVNEHPEGFEFIVKERGEGLSGGQRQSVAIARALVNDPPILVFDEPTSSMDNQTEAAVISRMKSYCADKTLLLSTHRASLLALVDRVVVIDHGRIIADGPKEQVLEALRKGLLKTDSRAS